MQAEREEAERTKAVVTANLANKPRVGLGGRGGAGNWTDGSNPVPNPQHQEREQKKVEDLELKVLKDVDAGLAVPAPAYKAVGGKREEEV